MLQHTGQVHRLLRANSLSFYSNLIDQCLSFKGPDNYLKSIHAGLIKLGFNGSTFLGNRCVDMYSKVGLFYDALNAFHEIGEKNIYSWNISLKVFVEIGDIEKARNLFDEMIQRDVVSWNSMISGYVSSGTWEKASEVFSEMRKTGARPSGYTFSILMSSVKCAFVGKQLHCSVIRTGVDPLNLVVGNSLIDMYGKVGDLDYAFSVFWSMAKVDVISWNSLISSCCKSGFQDLALDEFCLMRYQGYIPDEFTMSAVMGACSNLRNLEKGKQHFCLCIKLGLFWNTIVSSSAIDLLSKCNRLEDSVHIFDESAARDTPLFNSIISSYARHGLEEKAFETFVLSLRENIRPTEFTLSSILSCTPAFSIAWQGSQVHSLVVKSGFESDSIVANSLVDMYCKFGLVSYALDIFANMVVKDLISWNTMIMGLTSNGEVVESISLFKELLLRGLQPDQITFTAVLLACSYGGFLDEGMAIFSSMEDDYGIPPRSEHYACVVDIMCRAGKLVEAIAVLEAMPCEPSAQMWESILGACRVYGDMKVIEEVAEKMIELQIDSSLPYSVLAESYEIRGKWESLVRVRKLMKEKHKMGCHSWIGIHDNVFTFETNQIVHQGDENIYLVLRLLTLEIQDEVHLYQHLEKWISMED